MGIINKLMSDFFNMPATGIDGTKYNNLNFEAGAFATLLVNVASNCGLTEQNYKELVMLQSEFGDDGFTVLAFPSDDFDQEPDDNAVIVKNMTERFNVNFPMF